MTILQEMVLIGEIVLQAKIAQRAAERLQATNDNFDNIEVWCSIQSILIAAGNVSNILRLSPEKYKSRGEQLRNKLKVDENNPLLDRKFRNYFEHYDERIDTVFKKESPSVFRDLAMNPSISTPRQMPSNFHRGYNSFDNTLVIRGKSLDLNTVINALDEIIQNSRPYVLT